MAARNLMFILFHPHMKKPTLRSTERVEPDCSFRKYFRLRGRPLRTARNARIFGGEPSTWRFQPFEHMPTGDKHQLTVDGAEHLSFAIGFRFHPCIVRESAFWDAYFMHLSGVPRGVSQTLRKGRLRSLYQTRVGWLSTNANGQASS